MSNMSKNFKTKSALRCMADGGMLGNAVDKIKGRGTAIDNAVDGAVRPAPAAPQPAAAPVQTSGMVSDGVVSVPVQQPKPAPAPQGIISKLRKMVGMANGGSPWDSSYAPGGSLSMQKATPKPVAAPAAAPGPVQPVAQPVAASPAAAPSPALAPPVNATPTGPTHSVATANLQFGNGDLGTVGDWAGNPKTSASGYPVLRSGGAVRGPGGPREDKVGPVMLSNEEYVLPAKTVQAMGGPEELDEIVQATNDGRPPVGVDKREEKGEKRGLRGYAGGGTYYADANGNVGDEPWKRTPTRVPPVNAGVPATAPQPSPFMERDITPPKIEAEVVRRPPPAANPLRGAVDSTRKVLNSRGGKSVGLLAAGSAAAATAGTDTEDYYERFGIDPKAAGQTQDMNGNVVDKTPLQRFGSDLAARSLGFASDLGNTLTFGAAGNLYRDQQPKAPVPTPVNPNALDPRDVAPESVLRAEQKQAANNVSRNALSRDANLESNGKIVDMGNNVFAGGVTGAAGKELENIEAEKGRARYANDAAGMYAAIQGHIANGDLETANKLAWDSQSRALVNQGFAARSAARQPVADPEAGINKRYDVLAEKLGRHFSSDRAKGNLSKHLVNLEERRALELGALRNNAASMRGQDMQNASAAARTAAESAAAQAKLAADAQKGKQDQANKDRQYKFDVTKFGADEANRQRDETTAFRKQNQTHIDSFIKDQSVVKDLLGGSKLDPATAARFSEFIRGSQGDIHSLPEAERDAVLAKSLTAFRMMDRANSSGNSYTGKTTTQYAPPKAVRNSAELADLKKGLGVDSYLRSKAAGVFFGNPDVVEDENGQVRRATDLTDGNTDVEALKRIYPGLRNK